MAPSTMITGKAYRAKLGALLGNGLTCLSVKNGEATPFCFLARDRNVGCGLVIPFSHRNQAAGDPFHAWK